MTWAIPNWYSLVLLSLASYRVFRLLAEDTILDPLRDRFAKPESKTSEFLACAYCFGAWISIAWWFAWVAWPHWSLVIAAPFAISAIVGVTASKLDGE